jgi:hypothetical protein
MFKKYFSVRKERPVTASLSPTEMPEFVLFGDSLTQWSFSEETQGFGLFLSQQYHHKVRIVNEGNTDELFLPSFMTHPT